MHSRKLGGQWTTKLHFFKLSHAGSWHTLKWIWKGRSFFDFLFSFFSHIQSISTNQTWGPGVTVNEKLFKEAILIHVYTLYDMIYMYTCHIHRYCIFLGKADGTGWTPYTNALERLLAASVESRIFFRGPYYETWPDACLPSDERVSREQGLGADLRALTSTHRHASTTPKAPSLRPSPHQDRS